MKKVNNSNSILWIFNLETDLNSDVLAAAHDWIEEFALNFDEIKVYSTHVGLFNLPNNVTVNEIGGGSAFEKMVGLWRLLKLVPILFSRRKKSYVFHHMSPRTALILGIPIKLFGISQAIWYSHSKASISLKISQYFVSTIFSSIPGALPLKTKKAKFVGHAINSKKFNKLNVETNRYGIVSVGRITNIKRLDHLLREVSELPNSLKSELEVKLIGNHTDSQEYYQQLILIAESNGVKLSIFDSMDYKDIPNVLKKAKYFYSGTPNSVDKAAIEAAMSGCLIISENENVLSLTGMSDIWTYMAEQRPMRIVDQILKLEKLSVDQNLQIAKTISTSATKKSDLSSTIFSISQNLARNLK
jgi:glycosyltransferase involved in cell wall biosynthesis